MLPRGLDLGSMKQERKSGRRVWLWVGLVGLVSCGVVLAWLGPIVADFYRAGFFEQAEQGSYDPDVEKNLVAIHRALTLYVESEGALPPAETWMDAAWLRLQTRDLPKEEAKEKLVNPNVARGADQYGFAYNPALAGKHPDDVADKATPLVWESEATAWNAHGGRPRPGGAQVSVAGEVTKGQ